MIDFIGASVVSPGSISGGDTSSTSVGSQTQINGGGCVSIKAVPNQTCGSICRDNPSGIKGTVESTSYIYLSPQKSDIIGRIQ